MKIKEAAPHQCMVEDVAGMIFFLTELVIRENYYTLMRGGAG